MCLVMGHRVKFEFHTFSHFFFFTAAPIFLTKLPLCEASKKQFEKGEIRWLTVNNGRRTAATR